MFFLLFSPHDTVHYPFLLSVFTKILSFFVVPFSPPLASLYRTHSPLTFHWVSVTFLASRSMRTQEACYFRCRTKSIAITMTFSLSFPLAFCSTTAMSMRKPWTMELAFQLVPFSRLHILSLFLHILHINVSTWFEFIILCFDAWDKIGVGTIPIHFLFELHIELFGVFLVFGSQNIDFSFGFLQLVL